MVSQALAISGKTPIMQLHCISEIRDVRLQQVSVWFADPSNQTIPSQLWEDGFSLLAACFIAGYASTRMYVSVLTHIPLPSLILTKYVRSHINICTYTPCLHLCARETLKSDDKLNRVLAWLNRPCSKTKGYVQTAQPTLEEEALSGSGWSLGDWGETPDQVLVVDNPCQSSPIVKDYLCWDGNLIRKYKCFMRSLNWSVWRWV